jgi:hypothetical protein
MRHRPWAAIIAAMATRVTAAPADRRLLGLDLQTVVPALVVLALAGVMSLALPSIDSSTSYSHQVERGDVVNVATGITLIPAASWELASGSLVGHTRTAVGSTSSAELVRGSLRFDVEAAPFAGTPSALLTRINDIDSKFHNDRGRAAQMTPRYAVTTKQGAVGVAQDFVGVTRQGSIVAFVFEQRVQATATQAGQLTREGVEVVVSGPPDVLRRNRNAVVTMIRSIKVGS